MCCHAQSTLHWGTGTAWSGWQLPDKASIKQQGEGGESLPAEKSSSAKGRTEHQGTGSLSLLPYKIPLPGPVLLCC